MRRELKTIEFLKSKASHMQNQASGPRHIPIDPVLSGGDNTEHPAHLLLGLQHSSPATPPTRSGFPSGRSPQSLTFHRLQQQHSGSQDDFPMSPTTISPDERGRPLSPTLWVVVDAQTAYRLTCLPQCESRLARRILAQVLQINIFCLPKWPDKGSERGIPWCARLYMCSHCTP
jgi:hypothetical protein